ncbi:MAG: helix-hairpin-helix domain-containing protein [Bacteroidota bacterium]
MENYQIADLLKEIAKLMELHGENSFKIKSYQNAAFKIDRLTTPIDGLSKDELEKIDGIGKSLSAKLASYFTSGVIEDYQILIDQTPEGVLEIMHVKGIGPKKTATIWKEMGIESLGELLYACNENRLIEVKGFGAKTQQQIKEAVQYKLASKGFFHFATAEQLTASALETIIHLQGKAWNYAGAFRRKCEVLETVEIVFKKSEFAVLEVLLQKNKDFTKTSSNDECINYETSIGLPFIIYLVSDDLFIYETWIKTGSKEHLDFCLKQQHDTSLTECLSEELIYQNLQLPYYIPELREGILESKYAANKALPSFIEFNDLKGTLHNHSTYSDGIHSLADMANAARELKLEYFGICDHSKSAGYANGLSIERVQQQQEEIDVLNESLSPFRIFKGIESDILADGSLDYPDDILSTFDFVVASVHSGLKMEEEKATARLIKAIENPYTTILGHPTGRLLLARKGYPIDHKKVIEACADNKVVIELNAHPYRLDIDWRWIDYCMQKGVMISINPDAHETSGLLDMYYGVYAARKGGLTKEFTFNALSLEEINNWFQKKKK